MNPFRTFYGVTSESNCRLAYLAVSQNVKIVYKLSLFVQTAVLLNFD